MEELPVTHQPTKQAPTCCADTLSLLEHQTKAVSEVKVCDV